MIKNKAFKQNKAKVNKTDNTNGIIQKKPCLENIKRKQDSVDKNVKSNATSGITYSLIANIISSLAYFEKWFFILIFLCFIIYFMEKLFNDIDLELLVKRKNSRKEDFRGAFYRKCYNGK